MSGSRRTVLIVGASAAQVAQNQEDGIEAAALDDPLDDLRPILDVRLPEELVARPAFPDAAIHVDLGGLSSRLEEVDPATELVVCERGTRSAEAVRQLPQQGIRARYLGGGLRWRALVHEGGLIHRGVTPDGPAWRDGCREAP